MKTNLIFFALTLLFTSEIQGQTSEAQGIEELFTQRFARHWRAADAPALAELWREDGDWMSLVGSRRVFRGRDAIEGVWSVGLQGRDSARELEIAVQVDQVTMIGPQVALVDAVLTFGHETTGLLEEALSAVVRKEPGEKRWTIQSCRVARIRFTPAPKPQEEE